MRIKRGKYYICCTNRNAEIHLREVTGWIIRDDESKLDFGVRYIRHAWEVTELSTGSLVSTKHNKPKNWSDIIPVIDRTRDAIVRALETHQNEWFKMCKNTIKKAYEEDSSKCCSLQN